MACAARRHTQQVIGRLVALEKGRFRIALGEATLPRPEEGVRLAEGLDVGEALLNAAHERDESYRDRVARAANDERVLLNLNGSPDTAPPSGGQGSKNATEVKRAHLFGPSQG